MTQAEMQACIEQLQAENNALKAAKQKPLVLKVSEKGGLSIYGLSRFPITLYVNQWERIFKAMPVIEKFLADNHAKFSTEKPVKTQATVTREDVGTQIVPEGDEAA